VPPFETPSLFAEGVETLPSLRKRAPGQQRSLRPGEDGSPFGPAKAVSPEKTARPAAQPSVHTLSSCWSHRVLTGFTSNDSRSGVLNGSRRGQEAEIYKSLSKSKSRIKSKKPGGFFLALDSAQRGFRSSRYPGFHTVRSGGGFDARILRLLTSAATG